MATSADQYRQYTVPPSPRQSQQQQQQSYPPQQQTSQAPPRSTYQRPSHQSHKSRTLSFVSQRSHKSSGSKDLTETHAEKEAKRLHSKADPTLAINEAEPSTLAAMKSELSYTPLRSIQHKDVYGNTIADPDRSNPTRNRWERPLDTIRGFEAAIDGGYARKSMYGGNDNESVNMNRRNSSFTSSQPRYPQESYYNGRTGSLRPETSQYDSGSRGNYFDGQQYGNGYGAGPSRQRMSRMQTEPHYGRSQNIYPMPHKDRSYETVTSAAGSGNSDQAGYQTDPTSSDNSSIDRAMPAKRQPPMDYAPRSGQGQQYGQQYQRGYLAPVSNGQARPPQQRAPNSAPAAAVPPQGPVSNGKQKGSLLRRSSNISRLQEAPEKRKSWFARRFSKNT
ncbi:hypothetical protein BGZ63DRAFT_422447 [Mariannaea sp. PMI_226]|nr:hypothetical protein BGZ63DRAFT_422447 [Mariannaea sp. PMI_226]